MTLTEFKAWFEGFTEDMSGPPSAKQWKKIQARVSEITGDPVTQHIFYDRYWRYGPTYYPHWYGGLSGYSQTNSGLGLAATDTVQLYASNTAPADGWNSSAAMQALGKADAFALEGIAG